MGDGFSALLGALSLVVTQFQSISSFTAVIARIESLADALEAGRAPDARVIEVRQEDGRVAYERLTLRSVDDAHVLVSDLSVSIPHGTNALITGPNDAARVALFRATAEMWEHGNGRIVRPGLDAILFLPERPSLFPGTLREVLRPMGQERAIAEDQMVTALRGLGLDGVLQRSGGFDVEREWAASLSARRAAAALGGPGDPRRATVRVPEATARDARSLTGRPGHGPAPRAIDHVSHAR